MRIPSGRATVTGRDGPKPLAPRGWEGEGVDVSVREARRPAEPGSAYALRDKGGTQDTEHTLCMRSSLFCLFLPPFFSRGRGLLRLNSEPNRESPRT